MILNALLKRAHAKENPRAVYAVGLRAESALLIQGSSRRITTMRIRPANIRVINRRDSFSVPFDAAFQNGCKTSCRSAMGRPLRRNRALARQAQPRFQLLPIDAELAGLKLQDLQRRLDRADDLASAPSRRADVARWTFSAADQAQPCTAIDEPR